MSKMTRGFSLLALAAMALPMMADAAPGRFTGAFKPAGPYVSGGNNYYFRVQGLPDSAGCLQNWAFVNEADSGSKGKIATLLMAYSQGRNVSLYVEEDGAGYCRIVEFVVQ
jgi:hypothetical protein